MIIMMNQNVCVENVKHSILFGILRYFVLTHWIILINDLENKVPTPNPSEG